MRQLFEELKRRNVYKVAVTYAAVAFVTLQAAKLVFPATTLEGLYDKLVVLAFVGFPIALVVAWAFELTPEGIQRTSPEVEEGATSPREKSRLAVTALVVLGLVGAALAGGWYLVGGADAPPSEPQLGDHSIAVLPFENMGGEESEQFTRGIHDDLLTRLSSVSELKVISRQAVERYRGADVTTGAIADSLGVRWVMEGGVQVLGDQIQVNAQLIDPRTETHAWAERYQRELTAEHLFALQGEITRRIARSLEAELTVDEARRIQRQPTGDLGAYRLYVRGRRLLDRRTAGSIAKATEIFGRALQRDSAYALAWAGLADARVLHPQYAHSEWRAVYEALMPAIPRATEAARQALELEPDLAEGHTSLAYAYLLNLEGPAALAGLRRAVDLKPSYAQAQDWLGGLLLSLGRPRGALQHLELAVELNPANRNAPRWLHSAMVANGRYRAALLQARRRSSLEDEAEALVHLKRWDRLREVVGEDPDSRILQAYRALADLAAGDTVSARSRRDQLRREDGLFSPIPAALVHAALGEEDAAFDVLGAIFRSGRDLPPPHLGHFGYYALRYFYPDVLGPLRADPRFQELIREVNRAWGLNPDGSLPDSVDVTFEADG